MTSIETTKLAIQQLSNDETCQISTTPRILFSLTRALFPTFLPMQLTTSNTGNNAILISRRAIVLTLVGSTPIENAMLDTILRNGYLSTVKLWMDGILKGTLGELDSRCLYSKHSFL